jgi:hypothetical protein
MLRSYRGDRQFSFWRCDACERAELDVGAFSTFGWIGAGVIALIAATVGLNGHPFLGLVIAAAGIAVATTVWSRFTLRTLRVMGEHSDGTLAVRNVHPACARAAVEGSPLDDASEDDGEDEDEDVEDDEETSHQRSVEDA